MYLAGEAVVYPLIVMLIECVLSKPELFKFSYNVMHAADPAVDTFGGSEDADVKRARGKVAAQHTSGEKKDLLSIHGLRKIYPGKMCSRHSKPKS